MKKQHLVLGILVLAAFAEACGPRHIQPFTPRTRNYKAGQYAQETSAAHRNNGSLFSEAQSTWLEDTRARHVGDLLVVRVDEQANAKGGATTKLDRESDGQTGADAILGILPALKRQYPELDTNKLLSYASKSSFSGSGDTERTNQLSGNIALRVVREMPNGDLFVEGTKVVLINNEEYHLYVSGLVRPADIAQDDTIGSSRIADAQVELTGRGDLDDQQRKGWAARALDWINPF